MKTIRELEKRRRLRKRFLARQDRLQSGKEDLDEEIKEKETSLSNLMEEYQEIEDYTYLPIAEEIEIDSLNLAMSTIQKLAGQNDPELAEDQYSNTPQRRCKNILPAGYLVWKKKM